MPRKTSQRSAAIAESKNEGNTPRRSGRAVTKQEASRSRRSSTAAQTAASAADSKGSKSKRSFLRDSTSPSESRTRETPATRVKSTRRNTGKVNYKESDGEEEVPNSKYDENFASGEELDDSESDEKLKTRGRSRSAKTAVKTRETNKPKRTSRSRKGRQSKKKNNDEEEEEENETVEVSDDSIEAEEVPAKRGRAAKEKETIKPTRSRRQRSEVIEIKSSPSTEDKTKQSRRSSRGAANKDEPPKRRPSRGLQAKRYAEEDDDDIQEISDSKFDEDETSEKKESEKRKRKRGSSPEEASKRLKDADDEQSEEDLKEVVEEQEKDDIAEEKVPEEKSVEEPMEVDESDSALAPELEEKSEESVDSKTMDTTDQTKKQIPEEKMEQPENLQLSEEKQEDSKIENEDKNSESVKSSKNSNSDDENQVKLPSSKLDEFQNINEADQPLIKADQSKIDASLETEKVVHQIEDKSEKDTNISPSPLPATATTPEKIVEKVKPPVEISTKEDKESSFNYVSDEKVAQSSEKSNVFSITPVPVTVAPPKESNIDLTLNGADKSGALQNSVKEVVHNINTNVNSDHTEKITPTANGAHNDVQHTKSPVKDQYCVLPGRKYVSNPKLNENLRQSIKSNSFGLVSYNLGTPDSDAYLQKDKLLNELSKLDAHIICLQQVAKQFFSAVLEPNLDALGFKSVFSQPQDSLKGMATFYKSSLFRLNGKSDTSLRELIEKELEASSLPSTDKSAIKSHMKKCGSVLFTHFSTVIGANTITVANVQIPRSDLGSHALQVSCLAQEVVRINGETNKPLLLAGEFNIAENEASYQLLKDGYLSNEMIEELQRRKDVILPEKRNDSLVNLLWKSFQHPSSNLCSCYQSVLDHEFVIPELKTSSPDLLWYTSGSLHTVGVLMSYLTNLVIIIYH
ncbi:uncharacterized protein CEXT_728531 [Caerostris extrusa]|uniref:Endonuclease/exonuclease/phosphatase domain-containing protein n=1 Tax=Caerostris extrusa TaxID=172846 RepID=A0AAV4T3W5_CAEEX|nr:uncharacterized protein CEXT_728531 [Caerostris extrusa]